MNNGILTQGSSPVATPYRLLGSPSVTRVPIAFRQEWHPEALDWLRRVSENGGRSSLRHLQAVNNFCIAIDAAGIRSQFMRLSLIAGENLNAALVPLYISTRFNGPRWGYVSDTNFNLVSGDYSQTGGITATNGTTNASAKWITVGFNPANIYDAGFTGVGYGIVQRLEAPFGGWMGTLYGTIGGNQGHAFQPNLGVRVDAPLGSSLQNTLTFVPKALLTSVSTATENRGYVDNTAGGAFGGITQATAPTGEIAVMGYSSSASTINGAGTAAFGTLFYSIGGHLTSNAQRTALINALSAFYSATGR